MRTSKGFASLATFQVKETQQTNLNSKYMSLTVLFNVLIFSLLNFIIVFHTCKEIFHLFVYIIYSNTALAIIIFGYVWGRTCFAQAMVNTLEECDILENVFEFSNVHQYNDIFVSINVQEFRSRFTKYVYYSHCARAV